MGTGIKIFLTVLVITIAISFIGMVNGVGFGYYKIWYTKEIKAKQQDAETEVFHNTQAFREGKQKEADMYMLEFSRAETEKQRQGIRTVVIHQFSSVDMEHLQPHQAQFVMEMRNYSPEINYRKDTLK